MKIREENKKKTKSTSCNLDRKAAGALVRLRDITDHSNDPQCVLKTVFHSSPLVMQTK